MPSSDEFHVGSCLATTGSLVSREVLEHSTGRWGALVLVFLTPGAARFSDVKRGVAGISDRVLSQILQRLERHGLVNRIAYDRANSRVDYSLTPAGAAIALRLTELIATIEEHMPTILAAQQHRTGSDRGR